MEKQKYKSTFSTLQFFYYVYWYHSMILSTRLTQKWWELLSYTLSPTNNIACHALRIRVIYHKDPHLMVSFFSLDLVIFHERFNVCIAITIMYVQK